MKRNFLKVIIAVAGLSLASCLGQHNEWPSKKPNPESERIYGNVDGEPKQLGNEYPEDESGEIAEKANKIRDEWFAE